uniref:Zinc metalloproteinase n=1 Tax=Parastrongyloides trichosuri TaxID=131310 RepID=A0A0N4ZGX9_PARTI
MILNKRFIYILFFVVFIQAIKRSDRRKQMRKSLSTINEKNFNSTITGMEKLNALSRRLLKIDRYVNKTEEDNEDVEEVLLENPDLYQGDLILTEEQVNEVINSVVKDAEEKNIDVSDIKGTTENNSRKKRAFMTDPRMEWTQFPIAYYVEPEVNSEKIAAALTQISEETCITFTKIDAKNTSEPGIRFIKGSGCWSYVGRLFEKNLQDISIGAGCDVNGIIQHEVCHALGIKHEQIRMDRDQYVKINTTNILAGQEHNFVIVTSELNYSIPYDYGSAMQYRRNAFTSNGSPTMLPTNGLFGRTMGQREKLSFNDFKYLNLKYCSTICPTAKECFMGGYQDPHKCGYCKCPYGYIGTACLTKVLNATLCGTQQFTATTTNQTLTITGEKDCYYYINTDKGYKIQLSGITTNLENNDPCKMSL